MLEVRAILARKVLKIHSSFLVLFAVPFRVILMVCLCFCLPFFLELFLWALASCFCLCILLFRIMILSLQSWFQSWSELFRSLAVAQLLLFASWQMSGTVIQLSCVQEGCWTSGAKEVKGKLPAVDFHCLHTFVLPFSHLVLHMVCHTKWRKQLVVLAIFPRRAHFKMVEFALKVSWLPYLSVQGTCGSSCAPWAMHGLMWQYKSPCKPMSTWSWSELPSKGNAAPLVDHIMVFRYAKLTIFDNWMWTSFVIL